VTVGKWLVTLLLVVAAALAAAWYWLYRPQQQRLERVLVQAADCASEAHRLRSQNADLETIRDELRKASAGLQQQVAAKEQEMAGLRSTHEELIGALKQEIADKQIEVERVRDRLRVDMVDEVLFDSGVADLKPEGAVVLKKIGAVLAHAADRGIEVQGHTDNVPIRGVLARRYPTNWELSAARATNVVRFLQDQAGLDPKRISAAAYGEHQPRVSNDTDEGRRRNRRIELLLLPLPPASQNTSSGAPAPVATPAASPSPRAGGWEAQGRKAD
jgi:chemotaxis protein MotB